MADAFDCPICLRLISTDGVDSCPHKNCGYLKTPKHDPVNSPQHYRAGDVYETIRVIEAWRLGYHLGNTIKYISRAGCKDKGYGLQDLKKARWYLDRAINNWQEAQTGANPSGAESKKDGV